MSQVFYTKNGSISVEFTTGVIEERGLNVTAAHAAEIPENLNLMISKDQFITSTLATVVSSKTTRAKLFDLIATATPNLII